MQDNESKVFDQYRKKTNNQNAYFSCYWKKSDDQIYWVLQVTSLYIEYSNRFISMFFVFFLRKRISANL